MAIEEQALNGESGVIAAEVQAEKPAETAAEPQSAEKASYGKFKSAEALINAYNSLEAEFTRKSQKIKELETAVEVRDKAENPPVEPRYKSKEWQAQVAEFVRKNPLAKEFAGEIAEEIMKDSALARDKRCLESALQRILAAKYRAPGELISDAGFIDSYILSNQEIRDKVVSEYLKSLPGRNIPLPINKKGEITLAPPSRPKSLKEAGELTVKLLNRR